MSSKDNDSNHDGDKAESQEMPVKPLAATRSRRANAGNRMGLMILEEEDQFYSNIYGGFLDKDDEDDDDFDGDAAVANHNDDDDDGDDDDDDDEDEDDDDDDEDEDEDEDEDDDDEDDNGDDEDAAEEDGAADLDEGRVNRVKDEKKSSAIDSSIEPGPPSKAAYRSCVKICSVCLGEDSREDDEIIECDSCGVSVHESCYGVSDEAGQNEVMSVHSNISSESTEPWFCEPCRRSVMHPYCELCPNTGGIFKQTDSGRWIHMVCALYTRGVTFENIETLTDASLFELNYSLFGSKTCTICEDRRLARSGICIGCDAGLCKVFFHATCAQKEGYLFESHSDEVDPYFAQCRQHADKSIIKKKKRLCAALHARLKKVRSVDIRSARVKTKLEKLTENQDPHLTKWTLDNPPPIPARTSRNLHTSPSLIIRLTKKSELLGLDPKSAFMNVKDEMETARQKWHIPPAFNLEFVAYCIDRTTRMSTMKNQNVELISQNLILKTKEAKLRDKFNSMKLQASELKLENESLIKEIRNVQDCISAQTGKKFILPHQFEQQIARCRNLRCTTSDLKSSNGAVKSSSTYSCGICKTQKDQHLLALCDTCHSFLHIYCLDPPLTRVPKKTKFGGWQCSDCSEKMEEDEEEAQEEQNALSIEEAEGPRKLRERIKFPDKYSHESMLQADFWSNNKRRSKKSGSSKSNKSKKIKVEN